MKDTIDSVHRVIYDDPTRWGKEYHSINLERGRLTAQAVPGDAKKILEVGSGDGLIFSALKKAGHDPVAFDLSLHALKNIQGGKLVQGTASQLPFCSNSFDLILVCEVLEHIPNMYFDSVLQEIHRVTRKYVLVTVPYKEKLEINYAHCEVCGCIFNGAYHLKSFCEDNMKFLFEDFKCIKLNKIVKVLNPDRTIPLELFVRHHLANEYLYIGPSVKCPLCYSPISEKPDRNLIGWVSAGMRYFHRIFDKSKTPLWYLAVYKKFAE